MLLVGGGTYYGLCAMLTGITSFDQMLDEAGMIYTYTVQVKIYVISFRRARK
jgi:pantothenate kinase